MKITATQTLLALGLILLLGAAAGPRGASAEAGAFDVTIDEKAADVVTLDGQTILTLTDPRAVANQTIKQERRGVTAEGDRALKEFAFRDGRAEVSFWYEMSSDEGGEVRVTIPIPEGMEAAVTHGNFEKPPQVVTITAADLKSGDERNLRNPRFVVLKGKGRAYTIDPYPWGLWGVDRASYNSPARTLSAHVTAEGLELRYEVVSVYQRWRSSVWGKVVCHAEAREYEDLHNTIRANYRYGFTRLVAIDLSDDKPSAKKRDDRKSVGAVKYTKSLGCGWLSDPKAVSIKKTSLDSPIYGEYATSNRPAKLRVDVPAGHYTLALNFGAPDMDAGPMTLKVNGVTKVDGLKLDKGRFASRLVCVATERDYIEIDLSAAGGAAWVLNGLTLSDLASMSEDYILTRDWWVFDHSKEMMR